MRVFKIPDSLANKYQGAGYALAASLNGRLVDIRYLFDIFPNNPILFSEDVEDDDIKELLESDAIGPTVRELQSLGEVHVGMCSSREFVEL